MARGGRPKGDGFGLDSFSVWGHWSYKRIILTIYFINIVIALFVLRSLYSSLYIYSNKDNVVKYTPDQIRKMEESVKIRKASEPIELIKLVKRIKRGSWNEESVAELPRAVKHKITDEILQRLRSLRPNATTGEQQVSCSYLHDIIYITSFVQVTSIISDKFWYTYLVIPAFGAYKSFGFISGFLSQGSEGEDGEKGVKAKACEDKK
ncbi:hypothetical protein V6N13_089660 [Hibiscus sabdariffa]|uniref:Uncharacterized protein n=1 Tax=Hibiscus sabdariffa TaxID=183260 RepID=A0ABR2QJ41_9ROSI